MIKYNVKQNKNESSTAYQKWYAYPVVEETIDLAGLAAHMEEHNTGFSEAMCIGVLKAMVKFIKEQPWINKRRNDYGKFQWYYQENDRFGRSAYFQDG